MAVVVLEIVIVVVVGGRRAGEVVLEVEPGMSYGAMTE